MESLDRVVIIWCKLMKSVELTRGKLKLWGELSWVEFLVERFVMGRGLWFELF